MSANIIDLHIEKGTDFTYRMKFSLNGTGLDLDTYTFESTLNSNGVIVDFTVTEDTEDGLVLSMTKEQTSTLNAGIGIYDVKMVNDVSSKTIKVIKGRVYIDEEVTV